MRKQDRINQQQSQNPSDRKPEELPHRPGEHVKGSAEGGQPQRPPREPGKLPLPD